MIKDHSGSERGNPLLPLHGLLFLISQRRNLLLLLHVLLFLISSKGFLYTQSHRQDSTHFPVCYTSRGALAGTRTDHGMFDAV